MTDHVFIVLGIRNNSFQYAAPQKHSVLCLHRGSKVQVPWLQQRALCLTPAELVAEKDFSVALSKLHHFALPQFASW